MSNKNNICSHPPAVLKTCSARVLRVKYYKCE